MSSSHTKKSALIIGGGFAGLAAAVFLDTLGFKVTLLEKRPILGGRAYAFQDKKTGDWIDNGQHLLIGAYHETIRFLEAIGAKHHLCFQRQMEVPLITGDGKRNDFKLFNLPPPLNMLIGLMRMNSFGLREKWNFLWLGKELQRFKNGSSRVPLDQTCDQWLKALGQTDKVRRNFWDILIYAALNDDPVVAGARMLSVVLTKGFLENRMDGRLILSKENLTELYVKPACAYLELRGHHIETGAAVKKIHILDNKVHEVELVSGKSARADIYFSSVPFSALLGLIPEGFVQSEDYFARLKNLKSSPILSLNFWFDREIFRENFVGVARRKIHWYFNKNRIFKKEGPPYHYMGVTSGAYEMIGKSKDEIMGLARSEMEELFPEFKKAKLIHTLANIEQQATLSPTVESEQFRPPQKSPFDNLYVIGDWTKTGLPATIESAVLSARLAVDEIEKQL